MQDKLQETAAQIREARSNEANFEKLVGLLESECQRSDANPSYRAALGEIKEKEVPVYRQAKETGGSAWPEFEHFVSRFEKTVLAANA